MRVYGKMKESGQPETPKEKVLSYTFLSGLSVLAGYLWIVG